MLRQSVFDLQWQSSLVAAGNWCDRRTYIFTRLSSGSLVKTNLEEILSDLMTPAMTYRTKIAKVHQTNFFCKEIFEIGVWHSCFLFCPRDINFTVPSIFIWFGLVPMTFRWFCWEWTNRIFHWLVRIHENLSSPYWTECRTQHGKDHSYFFILAES